MLTLRLISSASTTAPRAVKAAAASRWPTSTRTFWSLTARREEAEPSTSINQSKKRERSRDPQAGLATPAPDEARDKKSASPFYFSAGYAGWAKRPSRPFPPPFFSPPSGSFSDPLSTHHRSIDRRPKVDGQMIRGVTNGDDAILVSDSLICANDGVGQWAQRERGHAPLWSRLIAHFWALAAEKDLYGQVHEEGEGGKGKGEPDMIRYLSEAYERTKEALSEPNEWHGTTTASAALLHWIDGPEGQHPMLYVTQLGDCKILVVRAKKDTEGEGDVIFASQEQYHYFDCPRQLGTNSPDTPEENGVLDRVELFEDDLVLAMSDGVTDNLWQEEIADYAVAGLKTYKEEHGGSDDAEAMKYVAQEIVLNARKIAEDPFAASPFMEKAVEEGLAIEGGKIDDISVVVAMSPSTSSTDTKHSIMEYQYTTLNRHCIRILELLPADHEGCPLEGELHDWPLYSKWLPPYEAVSYVWGSELKPSRMAISGKVVPITESLDAALRAFRLADHSRLLWADATCINQENVEERNAQVAKMQGIYTRATRVLAWLGADTPAAGDQYYLRYMLSYLQKAAANEKIEWLNYCGIEVYPCTEEGTPVTHLGGIPKGQFYDFLNRAFFSRRWIIQEVTVTKEIRFCSAEMTIGGVELAEAARKLNKAVGGHTKYFSFSKLLRMPCRSLRGTPPEERHDWIEATVFDILDTFHEFDCKDPRDRLAAMKWLGGDIMDEFDIDYGSSVDAEYTRFATCMLEYSNESMFQLLIFSGARARHRCEGQLPSWVPDWRADLDDLSITLVDAEKRGQARITLYKHILRSALDIRGSGSTELIMQLQEYERHEVMVDSQIIFSTRKGESLVDTKSRPLRDGDVIVDMSYPKPGMLLPDTPEELTGVVIRRDSSISEKWKVVAAAEYTWREPGCSSSQAMCPEQTFFII